jgi:hypothetical protein
VYVSPLDIPVSVVAAITKGCCGAGTDCGVEDDEELEEDAEADGYGLRESEPEPQAVSVAMRSVKDKRGIRMADILVLQVEWSGL